MLRKLAQAILQSVGATGRPYREWAAPEKRPAAPPVATRTYLGEPRARRRVMAREWAKNRWREQVAA